MSVQECARHHVAMELVPAEPRSRCPNCHYMTHHLQFDFCPTCGRRMQIEEPEPHWRCELCYASAAPKRDETAPVR
jgi:hypothetical protein